MTRRLLLSMCSGLSLCACAGSKSVEAATALPAPAGFVFAPANLVSEPAPEPAAVAPTASTVVEQLPLPLPARRRTAGPPMARVEAANRAAMREPSRDSYVNAVQVYAWTQGALYRLYTAPERVSEIALQAGEGLVSVAAGDTARWVIGDTTSGTGASRRTHILVKPSAVGLRTNLVITTDRRVYHVQLESTARTAMASISWTYPEGELLALRREPGAAAAEQPVAAGVAVEALNFGYRIEGDDPPWRPVRAFGEGGRTALVNYRVRGRYYVVDRLFSAAELRLGEQRQQVVRIFRGDTRGQRRRKGRPS